MEKQQYIDRAEHALYKVYNRFSVVFDHGEGVKLYDTDGQEYLDFGAGIAVMGLGYSCDEVKNAVKEQMDKLPHISNLFYNEPAISAGEKLLAVSQMDKVFFTNSGTEAIEGALKIAKRYAYNKGMAPDYEIIAMKHSFHGRSLGALSVTGNDHYQEPFAPLIPNIRFAEVNNLDSVKVSGRGELHLSILIETLRREGYEFQVSKPEVLFREINGKKCEPMEAVTIDVPEEFVGNVIEKLGSRKGEMTNMYPAKGGYTRLEFSIPARGLIGYRSEFMTDTKGNGIMNSLFDGYEPYKGDIVTRSQGSLVAFESGEAITYGLYNAQERGDLFIGAGTKVYEGMVVGRNARADDMDINVCKKKQLTNTRASGSDDALKLTPHITMSLEQCMEFISDDELLEVTPQNLRMRKKILDNTQRRKAKNRANS